MSRTCKVNITVGPKIGSTQAVADRRICLLKMASPRIGDSGTVIIYGAAGSITFGAAGEIIY